MLTGELVGLRARTESDVPILHEAMHDDVAEFTRVNGEPWQPMLSGPDSPFATGRSGEGAARFSVVELATGLLAGSAVLWGIDTHNRYAHLGLSLLPPSRGRGLGLDIVRVLSDYGFRVRGLHRLQLETLADNDAMIATALKAGFVQEGRMRGNAWVSGAFSDEVIFGLLVDEWHRA